MNTNMGAITKNEIEDFAKLVLEGFPGWQFRWTDDSQSICIKDSKTIWIGKRYILRYAWEAKENVLHEAAHINTWPSDSFHGGEFYREYIRLLQIHMAQSNHEAFTFKGDQNKKRGSEKMRITNLKTYVRQNPVCWHATDEGQGVRLWFYLEKAGGREGQYRIYHHQWWAAHRNWDGSGIEPIIIGVHRRKDEVMEAIEAAVEVFGLFPLATASLPCRIEEVK